MNGAGETNGVAALYDESLERAIASKLIALPDLAESAHPGFGLDVLRDYHAKATFTAFANLRERRAAINRETVAAELERVGHQDIRVWFPALAEIADHIFVNLDPETFATETATVVSLADRRAKAIAEEESAIVQVDDENDFALRDAEPAAMKSQRKHEIAAPKPRWHRCPDLVAMILDRANEPWVDLVLGGDKIVSVRAGGIAVVMGPTGAGKTSFVAGLLVGHARHSGPVIVLSRELPADELAARTIGMQCDASWTDVLTGKVPRPDMERVLALPRMVVLDRRDATLPMLTTAIVAMRDEYPNEPILIAIDYLQIIESAEREVRAKVADVIAQIDDIAREHRVVVLAISQMSRAASRSARNGDAIGADSTDGGAESAAIERAATVTLSIGASDPDREDGTRAVDLSIGKGRMTGGDRVIPMSYCGRSGRWRVDGESRPAADVKAERKGKEGSAVLDAAKRAMVAGAEASDKPVTREQLADFATAAMGKCPRNVTRQAIAAVLLDGDLVEVQRKPFKSRAWLIWTTDKAQKTGIPLARHP